MQIISRNTGNVEQLKPTSNKIAHVEEVSAKIRYDRALAEVRDILARERPDIDQSMLDPLDGAVA